MEACSLPATPKAGAACILTALSLPIKSSFYTFHLERADIAPLSILVAGRISPPRSHQPVSGISVPNDKIPPGLVYSTLIASGANQASVLPVPLNPDPLVMGTTGYPDREVLGRALLHFGEKINSG